MGEIPSLEYPSELSQADVASMARGIGLGIPGGDLAEVTYRFNALMAELNKLKNVELSGVDPSHMFLFATEGEH